jgi:MFS family permease
MGAGLGARYWKLWTASTISNLGDGTSTIAYPWLATVLTRDPLLIAGVGVASRLPWLLFSLHAGAIVDRSDRRRLMITMNLARTGITAVVVAMILLDAMSIPALYLAAVLLGCAEVLYDNSAQTIMPRLVAPDRLERANGNLWGAEQVTNQFIGPPLGGLLIGIGLAVPFILDTVTFAAAALLLVLIGGTYRAGTDPDMTGRDTTGPDTTGPDTTGPDTTGPDSTGPDTTGPDSTGPEKAGPGNPEERRRPMRAEIAEGFRWLWGHELLRTLAIVLGIINLAATLAFATFVLFVQEVLDLGPAGFGLLSTATAVGAVLGSALTANVTKRIGPGACLITTLAAGIIVPLVIGVTSSAIVVGVVSVAYGFTVVLWNVITVSLRQSIIPDHLLGRVNSVYRFFGWGGLPIGALVGGALVSLIEPFGGRELALRSPFLVCAGIHLVVLVAIGSRLSTSRIEAARSETSAASGASEGAAGADAR